MPLSFSDLVPRAVSRAIVACILELSMASSTPGAKRPKLTAFGRSAHLSARGLSALFNDIRMHGIPEATSKDSIMRARRREVFAGMPHWPLLRFVDAVPVHNNPIKVPLQVPAEALHLAAQEEGGAALLRACLGSTVDLLDVILLLLLLMLVSLLDRVDSAF